MTIKSLPAFGIITLDELSSFLSIDSVHLLKMLDDNNVPVLELSSEPSGTIVRLEDLRKVDNNGK